MDNRSSAPGVDGLNLNFNLPNMTPLETTSQYVLLMFSLMQILMILCAFMFQTWKKKKIEMNTVKCMSECLSPGIKGNLIG